MLKLNKWRHRLSQGDTLINQNSPIISLKVQGSLSGTQLHEKYLQLNKHMTKNIHYRTLILHWSFVSFTEDRCANLCEVRDETSMQWMFSQPTQTLAALCLLAAIPIQHCSAWIWRRQRKLLQQSRKGREQGDKPFPQRMMSLLNVTERKTRKNNNLVFSYYVIQVYSVCDENRDENRENFQMEFETSYWSTWSFETTRWVGLRVY